MTEEQKMKITRYRQSGLGYAAIAKEIGEKKDTVVAFCRRHGLTGNLSKQQSASPDRCRECGAPLVQAEKSKPRIFCSDKCCRKWWKEHPELLNKKAVYSFVCMGCGKPFTAYGNSRRKYCSHACYISDRFKGGGADE